MVYNSEQQFAEPSEPATPGLSVDVAPVGPFAGPLGQDGQDAAGLPGSQQLARLLVDRALLLLVQVAAGYHGLRQLVLVLDGSHGQDGQDAVERIVFAYVPAGLPGSQQLARLLVDRALLLLVLDGSHGQDGQDAVKRIVFAYVPADFPGSQQLAWLPVDRALL